MIKKVGMYVEKRLRVLTRNRIVVAVSGGADSVALLDLLFKISQNTPLQLAVAHFDHALREESREEAEYVGELAKKYDIPFFVKRDESLMQSLRAIEERARLARYHFLEEVAQKFRASAIALAHNADDQIETVLMRFAKGSGIIGLTGIPNKRPISPKSSISIIRPLLEVHKNDILHYLQQENIQWCEDPSNTNTMFERNRIRYELLPLLRGFYPDIESAILRVGQRCQEVSDFLANHAATLYADARIAICPKKPSLNEFFSFAKKPFCVFDRRKFDEIPDALIPFFVKLAIEELATIPPAIREQHYCSMKSMATGEIMLPGDLVFQKATREVFIYAKNPMEINTIDFNVGEVIHQGNIKLQCRWATPEEQKNIMNFQENQIILSADKIQFPLQIRAWELGETMIPLGSPGTKKITKILADIHLPLPLRHDIPIIVDKEQKPLWLVGTCIAEEAKITRDTGKAIVLKISANK